MSTKNARIIIALLAALAVMVTIPVSVYATQGPGTTQISGSAQGQSTVQSLEADVWRPQSVSQNIEKTVVKQEFKYKKGETPDIPEKINQFGQVLTLASVSDPVESASLPGSRTYSYQVSKSYTADQLAQVPGNVKVSPVYGYGRRQVDRKETITGLSNNDVDSLPLRKAYTDTNGRGPGANTDGELVLAEVKFEVTHRDKHGIPDMYSAHVVYRGEENHTPLMHYTATATYTNTKTEEGVPYYTVVATYEGDAPAAATYDDNPSAAGDAPALAGEITEQPVVIPDADADGSVTDADDPDAAAVASDSKSGIVGLVSLGRLFSPGALSKTGAATIAAIAAAALTIVIIGVYNKRRVRESSRA